MKHWQKTKLLFLILFVAGCGGQAKAPKDAVAVVTPPIDATQSGTIQGTVNFSGKVPPRRKFRISGNPECSVLSHGDIYSEEFVVTDGNLQNAIVYIKEGLENYKFPIPKESVLLDQKGCQFKPHVIAIQAYQPIEILNSDPTMHNVTTPN